MNKALKRGFAAHDSQLLVVRLERQSDVVSLSELNLIDS